MSERWRNGNRAVCAEPPCDGACTPPSRSRTFPRHRARSSFQRPPRVQRQALRGLRGTRGACRRRPPARCLVVRTDEQLGAASVDCRTLHPFRRPRLAPARASPPTFALHRARSSACGCHGYGDGPPGVAARYARRPREAATGSVRRSSCRCASAAVRGGGDQLSPDGRARRSPRAVPRHLRHARPVRRRRSAAGSLRARCGTASSSAPTSTCPAGRARRRRSSSGTRTGGGRPRWAWRSSARSSPGRATRASSRTSAASSRPAGRSIPASVRSTTATTRSTGSRPPTGATAASACGASRTTASRRWRRRSAATPPCAGIAPGDIGTDWRNVWYRGGALQLNTAGYWAIAMDDAEYADLTRLDAWHLPLIGMAEAAGGTGAYFRATIDRASDDAWWRERSLRHRLARGARAAPHVVRLVRQLHRRAAA